MVRQVELEARFLLSVLFVRSTPYTTQVDIHLVLSFNLFFVIASPFSGGMTHFAVLFCVDYTPTMQ